MNSAVSAAAWLRQQVPFPGLDFRELKVRYASVCRSYYTLAAMSRRRALAEDVRAAALRQLFGLRSLLEQAIIADFVVSRDREQLLSEWAKPSFFGVSAKQGVSIRYALASCMPTPLCGGRCYAHDGRDRELHLIFRGCLNYFVGSLYEDASCSVRGELMKRLSVATVRGIDEARHDQLRAQDDGYNRRARIRFSHIGEMAATPTFTNDLASRIVLAAPDIDCIIYTRHPSAHKLDSDLLIVNFTLEGGADKRRRFAPTSARLVSSAWDGVLSEDVEVNFIEHHVEKTSAPSGAGFACPVTASHSDVSSCDSAHCDTCFRPTRDS